jgi:hypothetical protein
VTTAWRGHNAADLTLTRADQPLNSGMGPFIPMTLSYETGLLASGRGTEVQLRR